MAIDEIWNPVGIIPAYAGSTCLTGLLCLLIWDYPRVCGEHPMITPKGATFFGSSPRMRGALLSTTLQFPSTRIIPAYAGSTTLVYSHIAVRGDHPRVCGEHKTMLSFRGGKKGSSPRMRGARRSEERLWHGWGDHPRVCGEHATGERVRVRIEGSSPRMRGALDKHANVVLLCRIIPAYAGSTCLDHRAPRITWDHPRVCGEHQKQPLLALVCWGSSPRMRGAHSEGHGQGPALRIIPAYAGSTDTRVGTSRGGGDHPRVCGEHWVCKARGGMAVGSSPRMRGAQDGLHVPVDGHGIIPAYAGSTACLSACRALCPDHPRVCGEHQQCF